MKIRGIKIEGPNFPWYIITAIFIVAGGVKGFLVWIGINIVLVGCAFVVHKELRDEIFKKKAG